MRIPVLTCLLILLSFPALANVPIPLEKPLSEEEKAQVQEQREMAVPDVPKARPIKDTPHLSDKDARLYRLIFKAQEKGDWDEADEYYNDLSDLRLRGHIRYQRLMHVTEYRADFDELYGWLDLYADHPGANDIYRLANLRNTSKIAVPKPDLPRRISGVLKDLKSTAPIYVSSKKRSRAQSAEVKKQQKRTRYLLKLDRPTQAYRELNESKGKIYMDAAEYDQLQADIAASYLYVGKPDKAMELATSSLKRSGKNVPRAGWVAGLTSWKEKRYDEAVPYFEVTMNSKYSSTWKKAAAAFWASRSALRSGKFNDVSAYLRKAAKFDRTFYGVLAREALNEDFDFNWGYPRLENSHLKQIQSYPQGQRALLLVDAGQPHEASEELSRLHPGEDKSLREALIAYALNEELANFALRYASVFAHPDGGFYDAALYPLGSWISDKYYTFDKAFVHGLIRQESRFNASAESPSLAQGLMQILPSTAGYVVGSKKKFAGKKRHELKDPVLNLEVGQKYLKRLVKSDVVENDMVSLAIAYNGGPGNLKRWKKNLSDIDDALLFIEIIPVAETRDYVERVLCNYWIYRKRLGEKTPSLTEMASGNWPKIAELSALADRFAAR